MSFDVIHAHTGRTSVADGSELGAAAAAFGVAPEAQIILAGTPKGPVAATVDWLDVAAPSCIPQFLWRVIENNAPSHMTGQPPFGQARTGTHIANPIAFVFDKGVIERVLEGSHGALVPPLQPVERHLPETPPSPLMGGSDQDRQRQLLRSRCRALSEQVYCAVECSRERLTSVELAAQEAGRQLAAAACAVEQTRHRVAEVLVSGDASLVTAADLLQYCASGFMQAEFDDGVATLRATPLHACHAEPVVAPSGAASASAAPPLQGQSPTPHAAARPAARQFSLLDATPVSGLRLAVQAASQWLPQAQHASDRVATAMAALREAEAAAAAATAPPTGSSAVLPRLHALLARAEHGAEAATQLGGSLRAGLQASVDELTAAVGRPVVGSSDLVVEAAQRSIDAVVAAPGADGGSLASLLSFDDELAGVQREVRVQLEAGAVRVCRAVAAVAPVQTAAEAALRAITTLHAATGPLEAVRDEVKHLGVLPRAYAALLEEIGRRVAFQAHWRAAVADSQRRLAALADAERSTRTRFLRRHESQLPAVLMRGLRGVPPGVSVRASALSPAHVEDCPDPTPQLDPSLFSFDDALPVLVRGPPPQQPTEGPTPRLVSAPVDARQVPSQTSGATSEVPATSGLPPILTTTTPTGSASGAGGGVGGSSLRRVAAAMDGESMSRRGSFSERRGSVNDWSPTYAPRRDSRASNAMTPPHLALAEATPPPAEYAGATASALHQRAQGQAQQLQPAAEGGGASILEFAMQQAAQRRAGGLLTRGRSHLSVGGSSEGSPPGATVLAATLSAAGASADGAVSALGGGVRAMTPLHLPPHSSALPPPLPPLGPTQQGAPQPQRARTASLQARSGLSPIIAPAMLSGGGGATGASSAEATPWDSAGRRASAGSSTSAVGGSPILPGAGAAAAASATVSEDIVAATPPVVSTDNPTDAVAAGSTATCSGAAAAVLRLSLARVEAENAELRAELASLLAVATVPASVAARYARATQGAVAAAAGAAAFAASASSASSSAVSSMGGVSAGSATTGGGDGETAAALPPPPLSRPVQGPAGTAQVQLAAAAVRRQSSTSSVSAEPSEHARPGPTATPPPPGKAPASAAGYFDLDGWVAPALRAISGGSRGR